MICEQGEIFESQVGFVQFAWVVWPREGTNRQLSITADFSESGNSASLRDLLNRTAGEVAGEDFICFQNIGAKINCAAVSRPNGRACIQIELRR